MPTDLIELVFLIALMAISEILTLRAASQHALFKTDNTPILQPIYVLTYVHKLQTTTVKISTMETKLVWHPVHCLGFLLTLLPEDASTIATLQLGTSAI